MMDRITEYEDEDMLSTGSSLDADSYDEEEQAASKPSVVDQKQNRAVTKVRVIVLGILLMAAVAVSLTAYYYTKQTEQEAFEEHFIDQANKVVDAFTFSAKRRLEALTGLATQVTSHAIHSGESFPMVTLPDFERQATTTLLLAEVVAVLIFPIVPEELRSNWTAYSVANQGWINEGLALQETLAEQDQDNVDLLQEQFDAGGFNQTSANSDVDPTQQVPPFIFKLKPGSTDVTIEDGPGPYAPIWTFAPAIPTWNLVNFNSFSHPTRARELATLLQSPQPLLSSAADFRLDDPVTAGRKSVMNLFLNRWRNGTFEYEAGPVSDIYIPIFDGFGPDKRLAQVLVAYVYWQSFFTNLLPEGENGVVCVLENSCGQSFTYVLHGPEVAYVGQGDLHEAKYDDMMVETGLGAFLGKEATNVEQIDAQCFYNVKVYASSEMEEDALTNNPLYFALGLMAVFLFTSAAFLLYDRLVSKRHNMVQTQAIQSTAVVQSLFPEKVRDRLYENGSPVNKKTTFKSSSHSPHMMANMHNLVDESMPIADLHPECTVLFADISGFTQWSSLHSPAEVFKLLETLYATFDKIAKKRKVFKVETIGDCYVAVTGLPEPQHDHAVIMTKFALQCLMQVNPVLHSLVDKLGTETTELSMRFGLNSGPVTAGVLRGEKARFQLFGDTVNTASRIESNGQKGRIHISETTADLLIEAGFESWIVARKDKIEAKGKGKLQTFWISPEVELSYTAKSYESRGKTKRHGRGGSVADVDESEASLVDRAVGRLLRSNGQKSTTRDRDRRNSNVSMQSGDLADSSHNSVTNLDSSNLDSSSGNMSQTLEI